MDVAVLLDQYKSAFDHFDGAAIASHYMLPCAIADGDGSLTFYEQAPLAEKFNQNCQTMRSLSYAGCEFNILETCVMGEHALSVHVGWRVKLAESTMEFRCLYVFRNFFGQWKIFTAQVYEGNFE